MPIYDKLALGKKAREHGFVRDAFEKMSRLTEILHYINTEPEFGLTLALKGGTAINLTMFNLPRLSVDLDLDFTESLTRDEMSAKRVRINERLKRFMTSEGYMLKEKTRYTHALDSLVYSYANAAGSPDNLKIEINYLLRSHILVPNVLKTRTEGVFVDFTVRMLSPVELFASKIVALSDRAAARDLYDLNNMIIFNIFNESELKLLRKCAVFYHTIAGNKEQGFNFKKLDTISARVVRTDLLPMIRNAKRFDLQEARERVSAFLNERMALTEKESAFLKHFTTGRYEPQLLFEDNEIIKRIENHPMLIWRLQHIRQEQGAR